MDADEADADNITTLIGLFVHNAASHIPRIPSHTGLSLGSVSVLHTVSTSLMLPATFIYCVIFYSCSF